MLKQWSSPDKVCYFPAGEVVKRLPPGYYDMCESMSGIYFKRKTLKTENLLVFPDSNQNAIIEEMDKFWKLENKFKESRIPYKRGIMLYGPPGSGKTCTIQMVINNLTENHGGIVVDFPSTYILKEGYETLRKIHPDMPLIVMMEDLDAIMNRSSQSELLNILDGMYGINKVIFLATTNYPEQLGSRIMNRPSRFDRRIFIGMPSAIARETYIRSKLIDEDDKVISQWVEDTDGFSIAHIKELYVANKILGDDYNSALTALRGMKLKADSNKFDNYGSEAEVYVPQGHGNIARAIQPVSEDKYAKFGTGEIYKNLRKRSPDNIANLISEDLRHNNGLTL